jgi:hypothetical protein
MLDDRKHRDLKFRSFTEAIDTVTPTGRRPRHAADDWRTGGTGTQPHKRTDHAGVKAGRESWHRLRSGNEARSPEAVTPTGGKPGKYVGFKAKSFVFQKLPSNCGVKNVVFL